MTASELSLAAQQTGYGQTNVWARGKLRRPWIAGRPVADPLVEGTGKKGHWLTLPVHVLSGAVFSLQS